MAVMGCAAMNRFITAAGKRRTAAIRYANQGDLIKGRLTLIQLNDGRYHCKPLTDRSLIENSLRLPVRFNIRKSINDTFLIISPSN